MHELSLAADAVELIEAAARREGFSVVRRVRMEIGALSCVEPDALRLAFEAAAAGSCAAGAQLELLAVAGAGLCSACGRTAALETVYDPCPACGAHPLKVLSGMEMRVKDLDVE